jgi:predicted DNA-binding protein (UPF0251 family)
MPRPPKCRRVSFLPEATYFKPAGVPLRLLDEVNLSVEEAERKIADALLNGKAVRIEGGHFEVAPGVSPLQAAGFGHRGRGRGRRGIS